MDQILTLSKNHRYTGRRKKTVKREITIGPNAIKFVAVVICAVLALIYLTQSTAGANRSVKIGELEKEKSQLELEKSWLEMESTRYRKIGEIESHLDKSSLESVTEVEHLKSESFH